MLYLDNAATTSVHPQVLEAMLPYLQGEYGNPSSVHALGARSREAVEAARERVASSLGVSPKEIYFTSGGTEANNWAIRGIARAYAGKGRHIITSKVEHHAVLHVCEELAKEGYEISFLDVDGDGLVRPEDFAAAIRPDTILASIMFANNEIGAIQPIGELARIARERGVLFHTDAVQAYGHMPIDAPALGLDLLSASGHKFRGPKGVGFLYIRGGLRLPALLQGGGQERGRRAGTENVPAIAGLDKAVELALGSMGQRAEAEAKLRDYLISAIEARIPHSRLNGPRQQRLPNNVNFSFSFIEGESMLILLDRKGICASSGSACTSGSLDPSHVLLAIGLPHEEAHGSLRLSLSAENTREEMDFVVGQLSAIVERLRGMSPLYEDFLAKSKA